MTTHSVAAPDADAGARVHAVRHRYARRGDRATVRGRAYAAYLVALFGLIYLVPVFYAASTSPALVSVGSSADATPVACALAAAACWGAQLAGRFWGPLVIQPFLLYVFMSTDLSPASYLGAIARRRLVYAGAATLVTACAAAYLTTDLFDRLGTALPGLAAAVGLGAFAAVAWLWGQVRAVPDNLALASGAGAMALVVAAPSRLAPGGGGGLWLLALVLAAGAAALGRAALRSIRTVDLARLARESARASQARAYAWTGTLHHALDLYRPEPRGLTSALIRSGGLLRGYLAQGATRALRTLGRAIAAVASLLIGGAVLALGAAGPEGGPALFAWMAGAVGVYLGSGWVSETWRGLRDELTLPPLFGERWGGTLARTLTWPVVAVTAGACLGGGLALLAPWPWRGAPVADAAPLVAGSVVLALGARFLREMKLHLPLELLLPIVTPLGDLSGLRIVAWQFDGVVAVVIGVATMNAVPSALGAAALGIGVAACCVWMGLRRTGWAHRGLLSRLGRGENGRATRGSSR
ncbi:hypothetical protein [Streptomyces radicis]|uniref:Uncharacterized protein n=1 Tax=Streptomyces radicis TaxID=1750517 RepID=A0A3A9VS12_9ACTN|nr:hypothetical protein [Streptomyces radicis]RKN03569.1 hypothetical protein D7319_31190 [Streptomyces radicis]RKN13430.1 hypothetical protein D7318_31185 [Streptomyces radicis]